MGGQVQLHYTSGFRCGLTGHFWFLVFLQVGVWLWGVLALSLHVALPHSSYRPVKSRRWEQIFSVVKPEGFWRLKVQQPAWVLKALELGQCLRAPHAPLCPPQVPFVCSYSISFSSVEYLPWHLNTSSGFGLFFPLVKHCSAALVLEKQKAQFTSPAFPKSLSVGCPVLDEGGQRHRGSGLT